MKNKDKYFSDDFSNVDPHGESELRALFQRTAPYVSPMDMDSLYKQVGQPQTGHRTLHWFQIGLQQIFFNRDISKPLLRRRTIMIARIASCLLIFAGLTGLAGWLVFSESTTNVVFADVQKKVQDAKTVTFTSILRDFKQPGSTFQPGDAFLKTMISGHRMRIELHVKGINLAVWIIDQKARKTLRLEPPTKVIYLDDQFAKVTDHLSGNFYEFYRTYHSSTRKIKRLPEKIIDGQKMPGFEFPLNKKSLNDPNKKIEGVKRIWIDSEINLPVYQEDYFKDKSGRLILHTVHNEFVFGRKLDPKLFDLTPPADYTVIDLSKVGSK